MAKMSAKKGKAASKGSCKMCNGKGPKMGKGNNSTGKGTNTK